jgi:hypothetical protein
VSRRRPRVPGTSKRALALLPSIPDDLDPALKNALAIRNAATVQGVCPDCGAEPEFRRDAHRAKVFHVTFRHEHWCGCLTDDAA